MEYNSYLQECGDDDVLSFSNAMFKVGKFRDAVEYAFTDKDQVQPSLGYALRQKGVEPSNIRELLGEGVNCEVLRIASKGWQKGKVRIKVSVEFYVEGDSEQLVSEPAEIELPESPLDDLRQMINQETQQ
jgi:hypothetical protein